MRSIVFLTSLLLAAPAAAQDPVRVDFVKYPELAKKVAEHKGKVVLVDLWSTT